MKFLTAFVLLLASLVSFAQTTGPATFLPFDGNAAIEMVRTGMTSKTIRLHDRTQAPSSYKVGMVLALVNSNQAEFRRFYAQDVIDRAGGIVTVVTLKYRATR